MNAVVRVPPKGSREWERLKSAFESGAPLPEDGGPRNPFNPERATIGIGTFTTIQPPPSFVIDGFLPVDVGVQSAPGGSSKSTLLLWLAFHVILGRDFLGRKILKPGPALIISAEDPRRRVQYRAHHIAARMNLPEQALETLGEQLLVEDRTGEICRLAALLADGNLCQTAVVDQIIEAYGDRGLSLLVLDPYVFFGPGERLVNDGDSIMAQVGQRLVRELDCAVLYIAHSGKQNAREKRADQYASRGGSALPDGMRMVQVVTVLGADDKAAPKFLNAQDVAAGRILRLDVPKLTDAPPITEPFYVRRDGFTFEWLQTVVEDPREAQLRAIRGLRAFLEGQLKEGVRHTRTSLEPCAKQLGMARDEMRRTVHAALERKAIICRELPKEERQGSRTEYLTPGAVI
jgi:regulatory protein RepA